MTRERWTDEDLDNLGYHGDDRYHRLKEENRELRAKRSELPRELQDDLRTLDQELRGGSAAAPKRVLPRSQGKLQLADQPNG